MKLKFKINLVMFLFLGLFVAVNIFSLQAISVKANSFGTHFSSSIALYATGAGSETVNYTRREETYIETTNAVPMYTQISGLSNSCGPTAGAIIVGFYDKYYEDLIPDYTSYFTASGNYKKADKTYVPALIGNLYTLMRTNVDDVGVSESDCVGGLKTYMQNKGRSINCSSIKSSSKLNETAYLNSINANKPVLLFAGDTEVVNNFSFDADSETISKMRIAENHIYAGYGYYTVKYYNGSNNFRTDTYIAVACGVKECPCGYIKIASSVSTVSHNWLINAYSVSVS